MNWKPTKTVSVKPGPAQIEDEREDDADARVKPERWATVHAAIGIRMGDAKASAEEKWATARMAVLTDLTDELASAAAIAQLDNQEWEEWLSSSESCFDAMPSIGRVQAVTYQRLCDPRYPWHRGDLSDMHFLSCAAGYADFLLGEKATSHDLRRAERRVSAGARICGSVGELVDLL